MTTFTPAQVAKIAQNAALAELEARAQGLPLPQVFGVATPVDPGRADRSVDLAYSAMGGDLRFALWANEHESEFYKTFWAKKVKQHVDVTARTIEDVIDVLDAEARAADQAVDTASAPVLDAERPD
jgi:hypothetical protein